MRFIAILGASLLLVGLGQAQEKAGPAQKALGTVGKGVDTAGEKTADGAKAAAGATAEGAKAAAGATAEGAKAVAGTTAEGAKSAAGATERGVRKAADATGSGVAKAGKAVKKLGPVDVNSATQKEIENLPGIGDAYAEKILAGRPYTDKKDLVNRKILPESVYKKIRNKITVKQAKA